MMVVHSNSFQAHILVLVSMFYNFSILRRSNEEEWKKSADVYDYLVLWCFSRARCTSTVAMTSIVSGNIKRAFASGIGMARDDTRLGMTAGRAGRRRIHPHNDTERGGDHPPSGENWGLREAMAFCGPGQSAGCKAQRKVVTPARLGRQRPACQCG